MPLLALHGLRRVVKYASARVGLVRECVHVFWARDLGPRRRSKGRKLTFILGRRVNFLPSGLRPSRSPFRLSRNELSSTTSEKLADEITETYSNTRGKRGFAGCTDFKPYF